MPDYPNLDAMGFHDPLRISQYRLTEKTDATALKIYLNDEGDLAHQESHSFTFQHNTAEYNEHLPQILAELDAITQPENPDSKQQLLIDELDKLEQVMSAKISELREDMKRIA